MTLAHPKFGPTVVCQAESHFVGVELGPALIRAGVFAGGVRLLGKTKFSTKLERGPEAVISRIARCVRYAADECDLKMSQVQGIAVGARGLLDEADGVLSRSSELGWAQIPLGPKLEEELGLPVAVANTYNLAGLGILAQELKGTRESTLLTLFLGAEIGGAILRDGVWLPLAATPKLARLLEVPEENVFRTFPAGEFRHYRGRDFRKALRKGSQGAEGFLQNAAEEAAGLVAQMLQEVRPDVIAIGGGAIEEIQQPILRGIQAKVAEAGPDGWTDGIRWVSSNLGDGATIAGAAAWAARMSLRAAEPSQTEQPQAVC